MARQGRTRTAKEDFNQHSVERVFRLIRLMKQIPRRSTEELAACLEVSVRSVYRYLNLIENLGFTLDRDSNGNLFIAGSELKESFTDDEAGLLRELLLRHVPSHHLAKSILTKLDVFSDEAGMADALLEASFAQSLSRLMDAIHRGVQVELVKYHSAHSGTTSNRLVEPIGFAANLSLLSAFECQTQQTKFYRMDRISSVRTLELKHAFSRMHRDLHPDMFGFALEGGRVEEERVQASLSMKAALILRSEYPLAIPFLTFVEDQERFELDGPVADFRAAVRFVQGFSDADDVRVQGNAAFVKALQKAQRF
jgi:proteasome accessory factor C